MILVAWIDRHANRRGRRSRLPILRVQRWPVGRFGRIEDDHGPTGGEGRKRMTQ
jgi:hypothetical protein